MSHERVSTRQRLQVRGEGRHRVTGGTGDKSITGRQICRVHATSTAFRFALAAQHRARRPLRAAVNAVPTAGQENDALLGEDVHGRHRKVLPRPLTKLNYSFKLKSKGIYTIEALDRRSDVVQVHVR